MTITKIGFAALLLLVGATRVVAQESGIALRTVRVLAADPEAAAAFYEKAFGMSEVARPANTATFKEISINSGSTPDIAKKSASTPIVITTKPKDAVAPAMPSVILNVPDIEKAIEAVKAAGGSVQRPPSKSGQGVTFSFVKDPEGNLVELVLLQK